MSSVVIDTSVWIHCFRRGDDPLAERVRGLVRRDQAMLVGPVLTELLHGVRAGKERRELADLLRVLPFSETEREDWEYAGEALCSLREKGITLPVSDALIASMAARRGLAILTLDKHFDDLPAKRVAVA